MKAFLLICLLVPSVTFSKERKVYTCPIEENFTIDISLIDREKPNISLLYKNIPYHSCLYNNTPMSRLHDDNAQIVSAHWVLKKNECTTYSDKYKNRFELMEEISFRQAVGKGENIIQAISGLQPLRCFPKK